MPDGVRALLEERARALARPADAAERHDGTDVVVLLVSGERYGIDIHHVMEIQPAPAITPVPGAPPLWAGVANVRGTLYPVLDLRTYLGLAEGDAGRMLALVSGAGLDVALLADDVPEVREVDLSKLRPLRGTSDLAGGAIRGATPDLLSVLDLDALLSDPRLVVDEQPV